MGNGHSSSRAAGGGDGPQGRRGEEERVMSGFFFNFFSFLSFLKILMCSSSTGLLHGKICHVLFIKSPPPLPLPFPFLSPPSRFLSSLPCPALPCPDFPPLLPGVLRVFGGFYENVVVRGSCLVRGSEGVLDFNFLEIFGGGGGWVLNGGFEEIGEIGLILEQKEGVMKRKVEF